MHNPQNETLLANSKRSYSRVGAAAYLQAENFPKAIEDAHAAIALKPDYGKPYYRKALALRSLEQLGEAIQFLEAAPESVRQEPQIKAIAATLRQESESERLLAAGRSVRALVLDPAEKAKLDRFVKWLRDEGVSFDKMMMVQYAPGYRGVHSKRSIATKETLIKVPKAALITLEMAKASPIGQKMLPVHKLLQSPKHSFLAVFLLQERGRADSKWAAYFAILPSSFAHFPVCFTAEEKKWLEGSPFLSASSPHPSSAAGEQDRRNRARLSDDPNSRTRALVLHVGGVRERPHAGLKSDFRCQDPRNSHRRAGSPGRYEEY